MIDKSDRPFHFEIWRGPTESNKAEIRGIYYVENHNGHCGYGELALDFEMATELLIERYRDNGTTNWMAPLAQTARQTLELRLKDLATSIRARDRSLPNGLLGRHDLSQLWLACLGWLRQSGHGIDEDARLDDAQHLIMAFHHIDPKGDLFRFGMSRESWWGKPKSYDRVGIILDVFERQFLAATGLLSHWEAVVRREPLARERGWDADPYFDKESYPRKPG